MRASRIYLAAREPQNPSLHSQKGKQSVAARVVKLRQKRKVRHDEANNHLQKELKSEARERYIAD